MGYGNIILRIRSSWRTGVNIWTSPHTLGNLSILILTDIRSLGIFYTCSGISRPDGMSYAGHSLYQIIWNSGVTASERREAAAAVHFKRGSAEYYKTFVKDRNHSRLQKHPMLFCVIVYEPLARATMVMGGQQSESQEKGDCTIGRIRMEQSLGLRPLVWHHAY